jgi:iron complex outermembrane receptor protein
MLHQPQTESMRYSSINKKVLTVVLCSLQIGFLLAQEGHIKGRITNGTDNLPSATVTIGNKTKLTDIHGEFSFSVKAGSYILMITHVGYKKIEKFVSVKAGTTQIFDYILTPDDQVGEEIVVLGSRSTIQRSNLNTAVPVDVFTSDKLVQTGQLGSIQMLNYLVPSLNAGRQELNEPVTLRGLGPDHLLVLMNAGRYHSSAWLNNGTPKYSLARGSVTNDLNSIPFPAIEKIEILRDGASAQYGSDAIAGVINIRLKESTGKTSIQLHTGQTYEGDGEKFSIGINRGIAIGKKLSAVRQGFINLSVSYRYQAPTTRAGEYQNTVYIPYPTNPNSTAADSAIIKAKDDSIINVKGIDKKEFSKYNGINKVISSGFLVNGGYPISNNAELFWTSASNYRENHNAGTYRYPKNTDQVNRALFPDGFRPDVKTNNWDFSTIAGLRGETKNSWHWKISSSIGSNSNDRYVSNSNNASQQFTLGKNAPTAFYLGKLIYKQYINNISFAKDFAQKNGNLKTCNLAIGAESRIENYQQKEGEEGSWENYDTTFRTRRGSQPSVGSVNHDNVVNKNRTVSGAYIDLEVETKKKILIDIAARYEFYDDFGGNLAGKLAVRYKVSEKFSLRGAFSNGFRAPSMQQRFFEGTQSFRAAGQTLISGIFNNDSKVTKAFEIPSLQAERSVHLSGGFTARFSGNFSLTVDAYCIQIKNRIVLSGAFSRTDPDVAAILINDRDIDLVQFYVNAINTRTYGADMVLNGKWNINKSKLGLILAANFNRNCIFGKIKTTDKISNTSRYTNTLFGIQERTTLEKDQPGEKIILSATLNKGKFGFALRNTLFGNTASTEIVTNPIDTLYDFFSSKILTDVSINYTPNSWLTITVGANNIFDVYPDRLKNFRTSSGGISIYSNGATPFGSNGGYYFVSLSFKW